jgi:hypothetical protein
MVTIVISGYQGNVYELVIAHLFWISSINYGFQVKLDCSKTGAGGRPC